MWKIRQLKKIIKGNNAKTLLFFNVILFSIFFIGFFFIDFSPMWLIGSFVIYYLMICCGVSITYHRSLTHKALIMPKWLERTFSTFACLAGTGSPIMWVMTHRQHHRYSDKEGDPHPPSSVYKTLFGVYPRVTGYIRDIVADRYYRIWHRYYFGILILWATILLSISVNAFYFIFVVPVAMSILVSNALNWFGHKKSLISYRNYNLENDSQNNWIMSILAFGEGWHNNHHRHPGSAKFGLRNHEIDISFLQIKILEFFGLAERVKIADYNLSIIKE